MSNTLKKSFAGVALVAMMAIFASTANAATVSELQAQIDALMAQLASLSGGSCSSTFGLPGVMGIQKAVNQLGYAPALATDGSFGPKTKAGVMWAQGKLGVTADGAWGNITNTAYLAWAASNCADDDDSTPSNGSLEGGAGDITVDDSSKYSSEEVGEDEEDVAVLAFTVEADDESDVMINSIKVEMTEDGSTSSNDLTDYAETVSVWFDGDKVGEADADEFNEASDVYTKSISLDGVIVRAGEEEEITVAVTALPNLDSGDYDSDAWHADVLNVRFEDADGVVTTEDTDGDSLEQDFDFTDFATAADVELKLTEASDNPESTVIEADDTTSTDDVTLLKAKLKAEGSDVDLKEMTVDITPAGTGDASEIATRYILIIDGQEFSVNSDDCEVAGDCDGSGTDTAVEYVFDDIDMTIDKDDTVDVEVKADVREIDGTPAAEGDSLTASIDNDSTVAEDTAGEDLGASALTGAVNGDAQTFYVAGIMVTPGTMDIETTVVDGAADYATSTIEFDVMAFGMDVYLDKTVATSTSTSTTAAGNNRVHLVTSAGVTVTVDAGTLSSDDSDAEEQTNSYLIREGDTATFTITLNGDPAADGQVRAILYALEWGNGDTATQDSVYQADMGTNGSYKTGYTFVDV